ncbi:hypothetical protein SUGI_0909220 [Cryptomeria japonica]|nr:hypothetical protein SUGI_0909220 [Cryptomeria japonica]
MYDAIGNRIISRYAIPLGWPTWGKSHAAKLSFSVAVDFAGGCACQIVLGFQKKAGFLARNHHGSSFSCNCVRGFPSNALANGCNCAGHCYGCPRASCTPCVSAMASKLSVNHHCPCKSFRPATDLAAIFEGSDGNTINGFYIQRE